MNLDLSGKNALVCGASRGIGRAVAVALADLGANITLLARSEELLAKVLTALSGNGQEHDYLVADFDNNEDLELKIKNLAANKDFHILFNNTGGPASGYVLEAETVDFSKAFEQHLLANHLITKILVPGMKKAKYGRIINVISTSVKQPIPGLGVSNTIRAAVANWAKTLATELGSFGITVNNLLPGFTETERLHEIQKARAVNNKSSVELEKTKMLETVPAGRFAKASEIGEIIAFLASPAASYINGINLPVDGGKTKSL